MKFSANLGFLWADLPLVEGIEAAKRAGFAAVECHWPYDIPASELRAALHATGLPMLGVNTRRGPDGAFGVSALPGHETAARAAIDEALDYGAQIGAEAVHVMAGIATGPEAERTFEANLRYACKRAAPLGITVLIEPINQRDVPGYFLHRTAQAEQLIARLRHPALRLMFDCYHVQISEGDALSELRRLAPVIGHIQIAAVPDRGEPDRGELDYADIFDALTRLGWDRPIGAEYRPRAGSVEAGLRWLAEAQDLG